MDFVKGCLIVLVMIGHFLPGTLQDNPIRYVIYSFHMPVFFFVSGTLYSGHATMKDYFKRMGIPWLVAIQVYYLLTNHLNLSVLSYVKAYAVPYYHLWYVVGFLFCITIVKLCKSNTCILLGLSSVFVLMTCVLQNFDFVVWKLVSYTIRPQYLLFFTIGMISRNHMGGGTRRAIVPAILFVLFLPFGFQCQAYWWEKIVRYAILCVSLIHIDLLRYNMRDVMICKLGKTTFPIYLWHVIGKLGALYITHGNYNIWYYLIALCYSSVLIIFLIKNKNKKIQGIIGR